MTKRLERKREAERLLARRDDRSLSAWIDREPQAMEVLSSLTFSQDPDTAFRAVEALGRGARQMAEHDAEQVREQVRRLLWSMNHESGNLVWLAPDIIGEMVANVPALADEYTRLLASFINLEPFGPGVHRAIARIAEVRPDAVEYLAPYLESATRDGDPGIRGRAARTLVLIGGGGAAGGMVARLGSDGATFRSYDRSSGRVVDVTVGEYVASASDGDGR
jgi:HEAT repeat protein